VRTRLGGRLLVPATELLHPPQGDDLARCLPAGHVDLDHHVGAAGQDQRVGPLGEVAEHLVKRDGRHDGHGTDPTAEGMIPG
jgi:hypothetical protein